MQQPISKSQFAQRQGVSPSMVSKWLTAGMPAVDGLISPAEATRWLKRNVLRNDGGGRRLLFARERKESALASLRELEFKVKSGELVSLRHIEVEWSALVSATRNNLLLLPSRAAPVVTRMTPVEAQEYLRREIYRILQDLADGGPEAPAAKNGKANGKAKGSIARAGVASNGAETPEAVS